MWLRCSWHSTFHVFSALLPVASCKSPSKGPLPAAGSGQRARHRRLHIKSGFLPSPVSAVGSDWASCSFPDIVGPWLGPYLPVRVSLRKSQVHLQSKEARSPLHHSLPRHPLSYLPFYILNLLPLTVLASGLTYAFVQSEKACLASHLPKFSPCGSAPLTSLSYLLVCRRPPCLDLNCGSSFTDSLLGNIPDGGSRTPHQFTL